MTPVDRSHSTDPADVVLRYGELAAELEETSDPARRRMLRRRLAELDRWLDRLPATSSESSPPPDDTVTSAPHPDRA